MTSRKEPNRSFPDYTCPAIDDLISRAQQLIDEAENLRTSNETLREWANYWEYKYDELETDSQVEIEELKKRITDLEDAISDLK